MIEIYKWTNLVNQKSYVGQDSTGERECAHFRCAATGCTDCGGTSLFHKAIREHGEENFEKEVLEIAEDSDADVIEDAYINSENSLAPHGYNQTLNNAPFHLYENRWVNKEGQSSESYEKILDHIPVSGERGFELSGELREGFQIISTVGVTRNGERRNSGAPPWSSDNERVKELIRYRFPKLGINFEQRKRAGRMLRLIYLYYRIGIPVSFVAEELKMSPTAAKHMIFRVSDAMRRPLKPSHRPKKIKL